MRYLSICSGIEAATVAWHSLGWEAVAFAEIEKFPSAVLAHHYPQVPNWGDMTKFKEWPDADIDILVGGTPCQSFSVAGLRRGLADPRGNLMLTYLAILDKYRPAWMVFENVPGIRSADKGRAFGCLLGALGELGYGWAYRSLDAQYFHLAQRRERVFVVGCLRGWERAAQVLSFGESMSGYPPPSREKGEGVTAPLARSVAIRGRNGTPQIELGDECANALLTPNGGRGGIGIGDVLAAFGGNNTAGPIDVATAVNACGPASGRMDFESETFVAAPLRAPNHHADQVGYESHLVAHALRADGFDASEDGTGRGTPLVPIAIQERAMSENPNAGQGGAGVRQDGLAYTLEARTVPLTTATDPSVDVVATQWAVRRLTPVEAARLQGFPDSYLDIEYRGKPAADGPKYKALGNSMAVPCMAWLGRRIQEVDANG